MLRFREIILRSLTPTPDGRLKSSMDFDAWHKTTAFIGEFHV